MTVFVVSFSVWLPQCAARTWLDVVDPSIYASSSLDRYRIEYFTETDPFGVPAAAPSREPTAAIIEAPQEGLTPSPSLAPTSRYDNLVGCSVGEYLYELKMHDSWGDGWDSTVIKITQMAMEEEPEELASGFTVETSDDNSTVTISHVTDVYQNTTEDKFEPEVNIFNGGLASGREGYSFLCLEPFKCYDVEIEGGLWESEVKWDIRAVPIGYTEDELVDIVGMPVAKGSAPAKCRFSIPDEVTGEYECPFSCDADDSAAPSIAPSLTPTAKSASTPTTMPSMAPSLVPSLGPSSAYSQTPSAGPSLARSSMPPSDQPSLLPSGQPSSIGIGI